MKTNKKILKLDKHPDKGQVTFISLMPGLDLFYNEFNINEQIEMEYEKQNSKIIEINYCKSGRFGCTIQEDKKVFLGEGEIEVNVANIDTTNPEFPLGYYTGISIMIDIEKLKKRLDNTFQEISDKIIKLYEFLLQNDFATLIKSDSKIIRAFRELYEEENQDNIEYLKLKVLEIILLLQLCSIDRNNRNQYFSAIDINKIKNAHNEVISNLETKITLYELAEKYKISLTNFKKCFKVVYGSPYYTYLKKYKIHYAIHYLEDTNLSISEIALKVGYENTSKFISAFKELVGYTPREYRNKNVRLEHLGLFGVELENKK